MPNITRTVYGAALQTAQLRSSPLDIPQNTTLNEKFNILPNERPPVGKLPTVQYFAIGRGGHRNKVGAGGASLTRLEKHRAWDAALYEHMPFVLRPIEDDLPSDRRANYALRRLETHGNTDYYAYYLKRMPAATESPDFIHTTIKQGVNSSQPFVPSKDVLNPQPIDLSENGVEIADGDYLTASLPTNLPLERFEILEIISAATTIYGDQAYATLSEVAFVSGVDKPTSVDNNGHDVNFNEVIAAQVTTHICTGPYILPGLAQKLGLSYEVGATELLAVRN